jgi:hypothetical protein
MSLTQSGWMEVMLRGEGLPDPMTKQCFYDALGSTHTKTVNASAVCPVSIRVRPGAVSERGWQEAGATHTGDGSRADASRLAAGAECLGNLRGVNRGLSRSRAMEQHRGAAPSWVIWCHIN